MPRVPIGGGAKFKPRHRPHPCRPGLSASSWGSFLAFLGCRRLEEFEGGERAPTACGCASRAAMATRRASPTEPRRPAELRGPAASPPVLSLSHFCTKPFLCFGDVRLGASRTLPLALANPNAEEASVSLPRLPAAARGFGVRPRAFVLQVGGGGVPAARRGGTRPGLRSRVLWLPGGQQGPASGGSRGRGDQGGDGACAEHPGRRARRGLAQSWDTRCFQHSPSARA